MKTSESGSVDGRSSTYKFDSPIVSGTRRLRTLIPFSGRPFVSMYFVFVGALLCLFLSLAFIFTSEVTAAQMGSYSESVAPSPGEVLVIDTDAGIDDAVAIMAILGDPLWGKVVGGVTCVRGNTVVQNVEINVLKILQISHREEIPVYRGSVDGYMYSPDVGEFFGKDGLGDVNFPDPPPPASLVQKEHAAVFLADLVNKNPGNVSVLMLGPMTNVALALRLNPKFMTQVKRIIALGGAVKDGTDTDARPAVEYNVLMDPEAAAVVLQGASDAKREETFFTVMPSETVHGNFIEIGWRRNILGLVKSEKVDFLNRIEEKWLKGNHWKTFDIYAAVVLLRPDMITEVEEVHADVETQGRFSRGRMVVDLFNVTKQPVNIKAILTINKSIIKDVLLTNLS